MTIRRKVTAEELSQLTGEPASNFNPGDCLRLTDGERVVVVPKRAAESHDVRLELWAELSNPPVCGSDPYAYHQALVNHVRRMQGLVDKHSRMLRRERHLDAENGRRQRQGALGIGVKRGEAQTMTDARELLKTIPKP